MFSMRFSSRHFTEDSRTLSSLINNSDCLSFDMHLTLNKHRPLTLPHLSPSTQEWMKKNL